MIKPRLERPLYCSLSPAHSTQIGGIRDSPGCQSRLIVCVCVCVCACVRVWVLQHAIPLVQILDTENISKKTDHSNARKDFQTITY